MRVHACGCRITGADMCLRACNLTYPACTIFSFTASMASPYFLTFSHQGHAFRGKKFTEHKMCVSIFSTTLFKIFLILRRVQRDIAINWKSFLVKYPLFLFEFIETWIFWTDFRRKLKFHQKPSCGSRIVPFGRTGRQTGRQTDMTKLIVAFRNWIYSWNVTFKSISLLH
jgi:cellulose synthase/poly-beta-1,6-N-acetylglucosamine synthase-like glycosyltransferase